MMFEGSLIRRCPYCFLIEFEKENNKSVNYLFDKNNTIIIDDNEDNDNVIIIDNNEGNSNEECSHQRKNEKKQKGKNERESTVKGTTLNEMNKSLVGKQIAICVEGADVIDEFVQYKQYAQEINQEFFIFGTIISMESKPKSLCTVEWESTEMKTTKFPTISLVSAIILASKLQNLENQNEKTNKKTSSLYNQLQQVNNQDNYLSSDEETDDEEMNDYTGKKRLDLKEDIQFPSIETSYPEILETEGLLWKMNGSKDAPFIPHYPSTKLIDEKAHMFQTPLKSFLAFLPIEFWQIYAMNTNVYFQKKTKLKAEMGIISHNEKWKDVTVSELFKFFGILLKMVMRPMPGRPYVDRWQEPEWHPYTKYMKLTRFQTIRSNLQLSDEKNNSKDELYKVRPLLNVLKKTLGNYVDAGNDLTIDESSVSARSAYGRNLIFYNNSKPCGKYHFRFYFVCEADSYACLRFRVHTKTGSDEADGLPEEHSNSEEEGESKSTMIKLILDLAQPWFHTKRVINMDNYYTSPQVFLELKAKGVYARGTCRQNRKKFPKSIQFGKGETKNKKRGEVKVAVEENVGMTAFGWIDGNPVHMLTTADGTSMSKVTRRVKSVKKTIDAPSAIVKYNHGMQAVDRFDQLISLYSMAKGHLFKKYYHKLTLALMDIALTNAEIHYYLANPEEKKKKNHRYNFRDSLSDDLINYGTSMLKLPTDPEPKPEPSPSGFCNCKVESVQKYLKKKNCPGKSYEGLHCQVCKWEGRNGRSRGVVICQHGIRSCWEPLVECKMASTELSQMMTLAKSNPEIYPSFKTWHCMDTELSCFEKLHQFYLPKKLFGSNPKLAFNNDGMPQTKKVCQGSKIYWEKLGWEQEVVAIKQSLNIENN